MEELQVFPSTFLLHFLTDIENLMSLVFVQNYTFLLIVLLLELQATSFFACIIVVWKKEICDK